MFPEPLMNISIFVIACYVVALIQGENIKCLCLCHTTLMGNIRCTLQLHCNHHLPNLQGALVNYISLMTDAVWKWELVTNRQEVIHDKMFHYLLKAASTHHKDSLHTIAIDWSLLGCYTGFHKSE